jgi:RNA polymerase sigma-70 factor (ECF subfamily)
VSKASNCAGVIARLRASMLPRCLRVHALVGVLAPDVVLRSDGGGLVSGVARRPVIGADNVARLLLGVAAKRAAFPWTCRVNGATGPVFEAAGGVVGVMGFTVADQLITEIDFVVNPEKLHRVIAPSLTLGKQT